MTRSALAAAAVLALIAPADAMVCKPRAELVKALVNQFGESLHRTYLVSPILKIEAFAAPDSRSWTMLRTQKMADGSEQSCVLTDGVWWVDVVQGEPA